MLHYNFTAGKFTFGSLASVQYTYTGLGSFTESGGESLDLAVGRQNDNSIRRTSMAIPGTVALHGR